MATPPLTARYLDLVLFKSYADLRAESARTYAGIIWWVIDPLIQMAIYYVVFGVFFGHGTDNYVGFLLIGLLMWRWMQSTLMEGSNAIVLGQYLIRQVYLPKILLPIVTVITNTVKFALSFVLLLIFLWFYGCPVGATYAALPILLAIELLLITGLTTLFAAATPFLPDVRIVLDNVLRAAAFISGLFFSGADVPERFRPLYFANPMAVLIESFRDVLLHNVWPSWSLLAYVTALSAFLTALGIVWTARHEFTYPKLTA